MDMNVSGTLSTYAYQTTLAKTGNPAQALTSALASNQSQAAETSALLASAGSVDPTSVLAGDAGNEALASLAYAASASTGNGPAAVQAMLASLGGSSVSSLLPSPSTLPVSPAALTPGTTEALARYAYDQSQNPNAVAAQSVASGQQALLSSGLNLLA